LKVALVITIGILTLCGGNIFLLFLIIWLGSSISLSTEFTLGLVVSALLIFTTLILAGIIWISRSIVAKHKEEIKRHNIEVEKKYRAIQISSIDSMSGIEFEHYLQRLLTHRGYQVQVTKGSGDLGVDLIAIGNNEKYAIQAKRYEDNKVSRRAISDAVAGMGHYGCNRAMVITNNYFTSDAIKLAQSTGCILIDRNTLANWIIEYQNAKL
jgi:restriction system protein